MKASSSQVCFYGCYKWRLMEAGAKETDRSKAKGNRKGASFFFARAPACGSLQKTVLSPSKPPEKLFSRRQMPLQLAAMEGRQSRNGAGVGRKLCTAAAHEGPGGREEKVVVIVGATGTGKSKLSIDLALRLAPAEVVNSDKMQVYVGLDVTTNKMNVAERQGVPHLLLDDLHTAAGELEPAGFRELGAAAIANIAARGRLPIVAGGSNSFVHALLADSYDPSRNPFAAEPAALSLVSLRYPCCLLWVDVARPVLYEHLDRRVEEMLEAGMYDELEENYDPQRREKGYIGVWRSIGVPEFDLFFEKYPPGSRGSPGWAAAYRAAVEEVKENSRRLADAQIRKIERLKQLGWTLTRVDATAAVSAALQGKDKEEVQAAWEEGVLIPSVEAVDSFLRGEATAQAASALPAAEKEEKDEKVEEVVAAGRLQPTLA